RAGSVPAGLSVDVQVTFNAERLNGGNYDANIVIDSNDPDESHVLVPAQLHVTGAPDITVFPAALEFGPTFITAVKPETVVVTNDGTDLLQITSVNASPADYTVPTAGVDLNPGERPLGSVSFSPLTATDIPGTLEIHSNDFDEALVTVPLHGEGLVPPEISVEPSAFIVALLTGESATRTLTIHNTGGSP